MDRAPGRVLVENVAVPGPVLLSGRTASGGHNHEKNLIRCASGCGSSFFIIKVAAELMGSPPVLKPKR
jgi:hypothetical protein